MGATPLISLDTLQGPSYNIVDPGNVQNIAAQWAKSRNTWSRIPDLRKSSSDKCRWHLQQLCPDLGKKGEFARLAAAGLVEIHFHQSDNAKLGWSIPWEFLLSSATENERQSPLLVFRRLDCPSSGPNSGRDRISRPQSLLVSANNPGYLGRTYHDNSFHREANVVKVHLGLQALPPLHNQTLESIRQSIGANNPHVIHVAGVDGKQAASLAAPGAEVSIPDGESLMVADGNGGAVPATSDLLAPVLCAGATKPAFIGLNFVYSGGDLAPAMVLNGAAGALGFLNDFDDIAAEIFYFNFYLAWRLSNWNLLDALRLAWWQSSTRENERLRGTGIVLWTRDSVLDHARAGGTADASGAGSPPAELLRSFAKELDQPIPEGDWEDIRAFAQPLEKINYALLHNDRSLFKYFYVRKPQVVGSLKDLKIDVVLQTGPEPTRFHTSGDLSGSVWPLLDVVRLPLTSALTRSLREITRTQLSVQVAWKNRIVFDRSFPVSLMPIEEWQNDTLNRRWLPSFVLPRDPSVAGVIDFAQPYLTALADSIETGFDGYQKDAVDTQVAAIWWALIGNLSLNYIGAPPSYGVDAQRLRSPSSVLRGRRGTCIDLALLLASCLEYIDLHPLLFLLKRHAFAGYYKTAGSSKAVHEWITESGDPDAASWVLGDSFYPKMIELINAGEIVPIETTGLAKKWGFGRAIQEAKHKLCEKGKFEWLMDIKLARDCGVTPLPLLEKE